MPYQGLRIIDFHTHFAVAPAGGPPARPNAPGRPAQLVAYDRERQLRMNREWDFPEQNEPWAASDEEIARTAERWLEDLERNGVERVQFVTGRDNATLAKIVAGHPDRFTGLAHHRPEQEAEEPGTLRRAIEEQGLTGWKILGPRVDIDFDDPRLRPAWSVLNERRLPALIHFGWLGRAGGVVRHRHMSPLSIEPVAREFLDIPFVIPHFGCGYTQDLLALCWSLPNIFVDTSGSNQWMRWMPYPLTLEDLFAKFYELIGPERIVFGTDSSSFPRGFSRRYLQEQVRACRYLRMPEEHLALIFGGNAARLLHLG